MIVFQDGEKISDHRPGEHVEWLVSLGNEYVHAGVDSGWIRGSWNGLYFKGKDAAAKILSVDGGLQIRGI